MDMLAIMMGNMLQSTARCTNAAGGGVSSVAQAGVNLEGDSAFLQLLGSSIQSRQIIPVPAGETADPAAIMKTTGGRDTLIRDEKGSNDLPVASVMNILNKLCSMASERGKGAELLPELQGRADALLAELQKLTGQNGMMTSEMQERLRGVLNPAAVNREEQLAKHLSEMQGESSGEQNASEMPSALIASLNILLTKAADSKASEKPVSEGGNVQVSSVALPAVSVERQPQGKAVTLLGQDQESDPEDVKSAAAEVTGRSVAKHHTEMAVGEVNQVKPRANTGNELKGADAAALVDLKVQEAVRQPARSEGRDPAVPEVVAGEESVKLESMASDMKGEAPAGLKVEPFRPEMIIGSHAGSKVSAGTITEPVTAGTREIVSHEQIISQVKEKLAEQRISADNGQVTLKLHPAELGELKITVRMDDQRVRVDVVAENRMVKDALMQNVESLKEALARQNVAMERFEVSTGGRQLFDQGFREGRQQEQQFVSRGSAWLTGRNNDRSEDVATQWQARENALLDMMM